MSSKKIPIAAISGFLGAGKTTLLKHILENSQGLKIGVVVNDYGDINIDSQLVAGQTDKTVELSNGCICCSLGSLELDQAIGQFGYPGSPIDYIVIEASGLAEPADLATTLREASGRQTKLESIVAVLDADSLEKNATPQQTVRQQIEHSDFIIINKADLVDEAKIESIKSLVIGVNPRARIFTTTKSKVDVRLLLEVDHLARSKNDVSHDDHQHLHDNYQTVSFTAEKPIDPVLFQRFVNEQIPATIYRAKGIVDLGNKGHRRKYIFQLVGKRAELTWADWGTETPKTELVFIGQSFDKDELLELARNTIDKTPDAHSDQNVALPKGQN